MKPSCRWTTLLVIAVISVAPGSRLAPPAHALVDEGAEGAETFTFASIGDSHSLTQEFTDTMAQIATLNPDLAIHNGDLEHDGVTTAAMNAMTTVLKNVDSLQ